MEQLWKLFPAGARHQVELWKAAKSRTPAAPGTRRGSLSPDKCSSQLCLAILAQQHGRSDISVMERLHEAFPSS